MTTIILADDHQIVRQGIRKLLEAESGFEVIGEASGGNEAITLVQKLQPDILVVDLVMDGMSGLEVTRQVKKLNPRVNVIILSMYGNESYVVEGLRAKASAYVLKESSSDELVRAVHEAAAGHLYLSDSLSQKAIDTYVQKMVSTIPDPASVLTARERQVMYLVASGKTSVEIAAELFVSRRTVEIHRANIMHKLGLHTRADLIRFALDCGILPHQNVSDVIKPD